MAARSILGLRPDRAELNRIKALWCFEFEVWNLEFGIWNLEFGIFTP
jgi:hypothetical protein